MPKNKDKKAKVTPEVPVYKRPVSDEKPDFIYGGPFILVKDTPQFIDTIQPINLPLQGTFKKSFAYYSLKERLPIILTKVIDQLSKQGEKEAIQYIAKLKSDLIRNKKYDLFKLDHPQAQKWNEWIEELQHPYYFTNTWVFSECYVYARLWEGLQLNGLKDFDPFEEQKKEAFASTLEPMCVVATKLVIMLSESEEEQRKLDFMKLLKLALWSNKCDLSLSAGAPVSMRPQGDGDANAESEDPKSEDVVQKGQVINPFKMIIEFKDKLLVDQSAKVAEAVVAKAEGLAKKIAEPVPAVDPVANTGQDTPSTTPGTPTSGSATPTSAPATPTGDQLQFPCFAKMTKPLEVIFDIVCDNAGYELFTDLCLAHFLVAHQVVHRVRFHVKKIPWFVSDVTERDFLYVVRACSEASFHKRVHPDDLEDEPRLAPKPAEAVVPEERYDLGKAQIGVELQPEVDPAQPTAAPHVPQPPPITELTAEALQTLGRQWKQLLDDGTFIVEADEFWVSPHVYEDMKKYNYNLYRQLQFSVAVLFKGDLNYRKLLGEINWNPVTKFPAALRTFKPAPVIALRTVKAELICGLKKKKVLQLEKLNPKWKETGEYGVIQYCPKAEKIKPSIYPCPGFLDYRKGELEHEPEPELQPSSKQPERSKESDESKLSKVKFQ